MVDPLRVRSVAVRCRAALDALAFAVAALGLVEADLDRTLASEPSFVALAAAIRSPLASVPPLLSAFVSAN